MAAIAALSMPAAWRSLNRASRGGDEQAWRLLGFARFARRDDQGVVLETQPAQAGIVAVGQRVTPEDFTRGAVQHHSTQALCADVDSEDGLAR